MFVSLNYWTYIWRIHKIARQKEEICNDEIISLGANSWEFRDEIIKVNDIWTAFSERLWVAEKRCEINARNRIRTHFVTFKKRRHILCRIKSLNTPRQSHALTFWLLQWSNDPLINPLIRWVSSRKLNGEICQQIHCLRYWTCFFPIFSVKLTICKYECGTCLLRPNNRPPLLVVLKSIQVH